MCHQCLVLVASARLTFLTRFSKTHIAAQISTTICKPQHLLWEASPCTKTLMHQLCTDPGAKFVSSCKHPELPWGLSLPAKFTEPTRTEHRKHTILTTLQHCLGSIDPQDHCFLPFFPKGQIHSGWSRLRFEAQRAHTSSSLEPC